MNRDLVIDTLFKLFKITVRLDWNSEIAEGTDLTVYSPDSPIGKAILGQKIGAEVSFVAPNGRTIEVKILAVEHFNG